MREKVEDEELLTGQSQNLGTKPAGMNIICWKSLNLLTLGWTLFLIPQQYTYTKYLLLIFNKLFVTFKGFTQPGELVVLALKLVCFGDTCYCNYRILLNTI